MSKKRNAKAIADGDIGAGLGHPTVNDMYATADKARYDVGLYRRTGITPSMQQSNRPAGMMKLGGPKPQTTQNDVMAEFGHIGVARKPGLVEKAAAVVGGVAGKVAGKVSSVERRAAEIVGHIGLDAHGMSNAVTRAGVDLAAQANPRMTLKAGAQAILAAPAPKAEAAIGRAAKSGAKRAGRAIEATIDPIARGIDRMERRAGDVLQSTIGVRGPGDALARVVDKIERTAKAGVQSMRDIASPKKDAPRVPGGPITPQRPAGETPISKNESGGKDKQASADRGTYTTIDGRTVQGTKAQQAAWQARRKEGGA